MTVFDPRKIAPIAGVGFILSFFIGLISGGKPIGSICIRAFLVALVFAGVAILISLVFERFLDVGEEVVNDSDIAPVSKVGGKVDINLADEDLEDDRSGLSFNIIGKGIRFGAKTSNKESQVKVATVGETEKSQESNPIGDDVSSLEKIDSNVVAKQKVNDKKEKPNFTPVNLAKSQVASTAVKSTETTKEGIKQTNETQKVEELESVKNSSSNSSIVDDLPDIGDVIPSFSDDNISSSKEEKEADTDYEESATSTVSDFTPPYTNSGKKKDIAAGAMDNAKELAAAIRTVLVKDGA